MDASVIFVVAVGAILVGSMLLKIAWHFYMHAGGAQITATIALLGRLLVALFSIVLTFNFTYNYIKSMLSGYTIESNVIALAITATISLIFAVMIDAILFGIEKWWVDAKKQNVVWFVAFFYFVAVGVNGITLVKSANYTAQNIFTRKVETGTKEIKKNYAQKMQLIDDQIALAKEQLNNKATDYKAYLEKGYFEALNNIKKAEKRLEQCKNTKCKTNTTKKLEYWQSKAQTYIARAKRKMQIENSKSIAFVQAKLEKLLAQKKQIDEQKDTQQKQLTTQATIIAKQEQSTGTNTAMFVLLLGLFFSVLHGVARNAENGEYKEEKTQEQEKTQEHEEQSYAPTPVRHVTLSKKELQEKYITLAMQAYAKQRGYAANERGYIDMSKLSFPRDPIIKIAKELAFKKENIRLEIGAPTAQKIINNWDIRNQVGEWIAQNLKQSDTQAA